MSVTFILNTGIFLVFLCGMVAGACACHIWKSKRNIVLLAGFLALAFTPDPAFAAKTWKLVSPTPGGSGGSGSEGWNTNCIQYPNYGAACIRTDPKTGQTECKATDDIRAGAGGVWGDCSPGAPFGGMGGGAGGGGMNSDGIRLGGYFVLSHNTWNGNLGGLAGADAKCLSDLLTYPWKGKGAAGALTGERVKAFLCDGSGCNNAQPFTQYRFATANDTNAGGAVFTTDVDGRGPNNFVRWNVAQAFRTAVSYQTGRHADVDLLWQTTGTPHHCVGWTSSASGSFRTEGYSNYDNYQRWYAANNSCSSALRLICMVHPE